MMVETSPATALVVAEAQLLLEFLIVPLDPPAQLGEIDETFQGRVASQVGEPELGRRLVLGRPLDQQPELGPGLVPILVAMRRPHAQGREARAQNALYALAPGDVPP